MCSAWRSEVLAIVFSARSRHLPQAGHCLYSACQKELLCDDSLRMSIRLFRKNPDTAKPRRKNPQHAQACAVQVQQKIRQRHSVPSGAVKGSLSAGRGGSPVPCHFFAHRVKFRRRFYILPDCIQSRISAGFRGRSSKGHRGALCYFIL